MLVLSTWPHGFVYLFVQIEFMADFDGSFHKLLGLDMDLSMVLLGPRSQRFVDSSLGFAAQRPVLSVVYIPACTVTAWAVLACAVAVRAMETRAGLHNSSLQQLLDACGRDCRGLLLRHLLSSAGGLFKS